MIHLALRNELRPGSPSFAPACPITSMRISSVSLNGADRAAAALQPVHTVEQQMLQISVEDWDLLFEAVQTRLIRAVTSDAEEFNSASFPKSSAAAIRKQVLDVVDDLEKLHRSLNQERSKNALSQRPGAR